jgi:YD repeat-containing protein
MACLCSACAFRESESTTTYEYDRQGQLKKTTYPTGRWVAIERDGRGLVILEMVGYGQTNMYETAFDYDANGNLIWQRNPDGTEYEWEYDNFDRVVKAPYIAPAETDWRNEYARTHRLPSMNPYEYANSNPTNYTDPWGLSAMSALTAALGLDRGIQEMMHTPVLPGMGPLRADYKWSVEDAFYRMSTGYTSGGMLRLPDTRAYEYAMHKALNSLEWKKEYWAAEYARRQLYEDCPPGLPFTSLCRGILGSVLPELNNPYDADLAKKDLASGLFELLSYASAGCGNVPSKALNYSDDLMRDAALAYGVPASTALSRGAQLRSQYGATFSEYMRYRGQGFTPAQAKYLTQPYQGMGHHFLARRYGLPEVISESSLNVMKPNGISIGQFYERHFLADPYFYGMKFPNSIGGSWSGNAIGLQKPGLAGRLWYGSPGPLKAAARAGAAAGGAGAYWWLSSDDK